MRNLILVFGDQLDRRSAAFDGFDAREDQVWMAEVAEKGSYVRPHQQRLVLFFSTMRHFRDALRGDGVKVHDHALCANSGDDRGRALRRCCARMFPGLSRSACW